MEMMLELDYHTFLMAWTCSIWSTSEGQEKDGDLCFRLKNNISMCGSARKPILVLTSGDSVNRCWLVRLSHITACGVKSSLGIYNIMMPKPNRSKKIHWRHALLAVIRHWKTGGLVDNGVLEALKITLYPAPPSAADSPELIDQVRSRCQKKRKWRYERTVISTREIRPCHHSPKDCGTATRNYEHRSDHKNTRGYWVYEWVLYLLRT